jgi:DNA repair protein RadA/Sms
VAEPAADLGVALALASSRLDLPVPADVAACGEVGLGGEIRRVGRVPLRLREAARLGFERVLVPAAMASPSGAAEGRLATGIAVENLAQAVAWLRASSPRDGGENAG